MKTIGIKSAWLKLHERRERTKTIKVKVYKWQAYEWKKVYEWKVYEWKNVYE